MRFSDRMRVDRSEAILDAASRVARQKGWSALTIDAVASEAGVAKGTVYLHYAGKETLLIALAERAVRHLMAVIHEEFARAAHPVAQLRATYQRLIAEQESNAPLLTLMHGCACLTPAGREASAAAVASLLDLLTQLIRDGQTRGAFPHDLDSRAAAVSFIALATFPVCIAQDRRSGVSRESMWSMYEHALGGPALTETLTDEADPALGY